MNKDSRQHRSSSARDLSQIRCITIRVILVDERGMTFGSCGVLRKFRYNLFLFCTPFSLSSRSDQFHLFHLLVRDALACGRVRNIEVKLGIGTTRLGCALLTLFFSLGKGGRVLQLPRECHIISYLIRTLLLPVFCFLSESANRARVFYLFN